MGSLGDEGERDGDGVIGFGDGVIGFGDGFWMEREVSRGEMRGA